MKTFRSFFFFILLFYTCTAAQVKNDLLFEEARITLNNALTQDAYILSQKDFNKSAEHYIKAQEIFNQNGSSLAVKDELEKSIALLTVINEEVENKGGFFKSALDARYVAMDKNANRYAPYHWNLAEDNIYDAIEEFKDHNYEESSKLVLTAAGLYSRAGEYTDKVNDLLSNWSPVKNADNSLAFLLSPNNYTE